MCFCFVDFKLSIDEIVGIIFVVTWIISGVSLVLCVIKPSSCWLETLSIRGFLWWSECPCDLKLLVYGRLQGIIVCLVKLPSYFTRHNFFSYLLDIPSILGLIWRSRSNFDWRLPTSGALRGCNYVFFVKGHS